jgi:hypothetical protein
VDLFPQVSKEEKKKYYDSPKPSTDVAKYKLVGGEESENEKQAQ